MNNSKYTSTLQDLTEAYFIVNLWFQMLILEKKKAENK